MCRLLERRFSHLRHARSTSRRRLRKAIVLPVNPTVSAVVEAALLEFLAAHPVTDEADR